MNKKLTLLAVSVASVLGLSVIPNAQAATNTETLAKAIAKQEAEITILKQQLATLAAEQKQQQQQNKQVATQVDTVVQQATKAQDRLSRFSFNSYGSAVYTSDEYFDNVQDTSAERRSRTDLERIVTEFGYQFTDDWSMEVEIEYEHGGTGTSLEYDGFE